ncbi:hypothetical protein AV530_019981 [Patagioenas fasciata monilis]|uniref:Uncharacterized protein n=1 Tax=Patagioenas fasciata monilis TaxID=372326 RepID=A0A1V4JI21_PATFA|nr:hypothetical protein AV530_019981 [Patagioenas fasciata monilis]
MPSCVAGSVDSALLVLVYVGKGPAAAAPRARHGSQRRSQSPSGLRVSSKLVVIIGATVGIRFALLHRAARRRVRSHADTHAGCRARLCSAVTLPRLEKTDTPLGRAELSSAPRTNMGYYPRLRR